MATTSESLMETITKSVNLAHLFQSGKVFLHLEEYLFILVINKCVLPLLQYVLSYSLNTGTERMSTCSVKYYTRKEDNKICVSVVLRFPN